VHPTPPPSLPQDTLASLPPDCSPLLVRLVRELSAARSFSDLHLETGLPLDTLYLLAGHLAEWGHARVALPLTEESLFALRPDAPTHADSEVAAEYAAAFGARPALPLLSALALFSEPRRFGDLSRSARVPARRLVQATVFLWQRRVIHQLQTCLLAVAEVARPAVEPERLVAWQLMQQLRPMLHGEHSLEELSWHEGVPRRALLQMVAAFPDVLLPVLMPAVGEDFEEAQDCG